MTISSAAGPTSPADLARTATVYFVKGVKPLKENRMSPVLFSYKYPRKKKEYSFVHLLRHAGAFLSQQLVTCGSIKVEHVSEFSCDVLRSIPGHSN